MRAGPKLTILIPCLNEEKTIAEAIRDAQKHARRALGKAFEIIVADNGSTDNTLKIVKRYRSVRLINVRVRGYGAALHWGILSAQAPYVLLADADLSYPFKNIPKFTKLIGGKFDLILGSRLKGNIQKGAMPWLHRYIGTPFLSFLINNMYGIGTSDCNSGMRVVRKDFYKRLHMRNSGMEWASELLVRTSLNRGCYKEVIIDFRKDKRSRRPHLSTWSDGWRHLKAIVLLKPTSLVPVIAVFAITGFALRLANPAISFFLLSTSSALALSTITAVMLNESIEGRKGMVIDFLMSFKMVPTVTVISVAIFSTLLFTKPELNLWTYLIITDVSLLLIWVFFIETVKTHMINRLEDEI